MKTYLVSWLRKNHAGQRLEQFERLRTGPWLVWEAGPWRPPSARHDTLVSGPETRLLASGESLAIQLAAKDGGAEVRLGRDADNDLVIDDATLSRVHLVLRRDARGGWAAQDAGSRNGTRVDGAPARTPLPLRQGSVIEAGAVRLTFYDAAGLYARLKAPAAR
ncbi:MAG TPA: FHA domain-containing protein [Anaeromyxobacter sp.]|nr:FHA domain-containing protein [Anaeromyxobacter sp.]